MKRFSLCFVARAVRALALVGALDGCGGGAVVAGNARPATMQSAPRDATQVGRDRAAEKSADVVRLALFARIGQEGVLAIVRDVRQVQTDAGSSKLTFRSLPVDFDGHGLSLRASRGRLDVIEMRASGTTITVDALLGAHVGRRVRVQKGKDDGAPWEEGSLVGVTHQRALVAVNGEVASVEFERVALPGAPSEPALEATASSDKGNVEAELTYTTARIRSAVGYRLVRNAGTTRGSLGGDATIANDTGIDLPNAAFTMTADAPSLRDFAQASAPAKAGSPASSDTTAIRFTALMSVPAGRSVSTRLFGPSEVALTRRIVIEGPGLPIHGGTAAGEMSNTSVRAVVDATTVGGGKLSPLGMLPGATELFEGDAQASEPPRWYGSTASRPLPGGIGLRVDLGDEKQFETQRRLLGTKSLGRCVSESSWEVSVTNPTEEPIPFEDVEPVTGDYVVLESSLPATAKEKDYFGFGFPVAGKATVRLKFRVRVTSCVEAVGRRGYWYRGKYSGEGKPSSGS